MTIGMMTGVVEMTDTCTTCAWNSKWKCIKEGEYTNVCSAVPPSFVKNDMYPEGEWMRPRVLKGMRACAFYKPREE